MGQKELAWEKRTRTNGHETFEMSGREELKEKNH